MLSDIRIAYLLRELRGIPHVEILRIGTKVPCALPQRITPGLCSPGWVRSQRNPSRADPSGAFQVVAPSGARTASASSIAPSSASADGRRA